MPGFKSIIDQNRPKRILTTLLENGTIPHALLFTGIEGVGKNMAATAFAMASNCLAEDSRLIDRTEAHRVTVTAEPCGQCRSCRKIESANHPDIIRIKPSGPYIKIAQIRALCLALAMKPYEARNRVVIISNAQAMNQSAANALLKVLEEPPARTILILTASQPSDLLPTVVSRCQQIRFNPIGRKCLESELVAKHGFKYEDAAVVASMANGSFTRALGMFKNDWLHRRAWLLKEVDTLSSRPIAKLLAFAEKLAKNKDTLPDALEIMKVYLRDLLIYQFDPSKIVNRDLEAKIKLTSRQITVKSLLAKIETIQNVQNRLKANVNLRLTLEAMLLKLSLSV